MSAPQVPAGVPAPIANYFNILIQYLEREIRRRMVKDEAVSSVYLQSSGGKVYRVEVDDLGVITTTLVRG